MKLTMYCNGTDQQQQQQQQHCVCDCDCEPPSSGNHCSMGVDDIDPDLAYATISPNVLVLETDEHEQGMEVNINGVDIQPAVGTPQTPASGGVDPGQQQQQQQQQQGPADGMIISTFPNHPTSPSLALAGLMTLDGPDLENEYVLAGGEHSENGQARDFTAGDSLFGSGTDSVHRSVHIKLDLKVTTTTKRTG